MLLYSFSWAWKNNYVIVRNVALLAPKNDVD